MNRVIRLGLSAFMLAALVTPAAQAEDAPTLQNQATQTTRSTNELRSNKTPTAQTAPQPNQIQAVTSTPTSQVQTTSEIVSERDRVQLEHFLQRPLPVGLVSDQVSGI